MCGICGKLNFDQNMPVDCGSVIKMMEAMRHRGPDDEGSYISGPIGLGHRRLSIIDLNTGKQPIANEDNTIWIVFNGEIYNYQELRKELIKNGHVFRTETDTEVIIHLYEEYGEKFLSRLRGMFAFALWNETKRELFLARDRVGIKPLYYYCDGTSIIFASEIKAILKDPAVKKEIAYPVIDRFFTYFYTPGIDTLIKNIYKLSPGCFMLIKDGKMKTKHYWDLSFAVCETGLTFREQKEQLLELLRESAQLHMVSDVPVGILLSGGVDSTALLNLSLEAGKKLSTFTIGFDGEDFEDERVYAKLAAEKFGSTHYEMTIRASDFVNFLPEYVMHMEEPVCEPPAIALYYISKLAKEHVKVLISGEGGDEAFAGYQNYRNFIFLENLKTILGPANKTASFIFDKLGNYAPLKKIKKYAPLMRMPLDQYYYSRSTTPYDFFNREIDDLYSPEFKSMVSKKFSLEPTDSCFKTIKYTDDVLSKMLYIDTKTWLPDDLLIKADKITMANSIELRVPLLDHKVLEFAANLPSYCKVNGLTTKYILKEVFADKVPVEIIERKKTGFPVPYQRWFRRDLKQYVNDILLDQRTFSRGYFRKGAIEKILAINNAGAEYSKEIFSLLVLELWHRIFVDN